MIAWGAAAVLGVAAPEAAEGPPAKETAPVDQPPAATAPVAGPAKDDRGERTKGEAAKDGIGTSAAVGTHPAKKAPAPDPARKAVELDWKPLWTLDVAEGEDWLSGPVAVRGRLIVVPSFGKRIAEADDLDGALVVDGKTGRIVRRITVPRGDVTGVALDGDFAIVSALAGHVVKARLDGLVAWSVPVSAPAGPAALADVNGDGILDALVPVRQSNCEKDRCTVTLLALDGRTGAELWKRDRAVKPDASQPLVVVRKRERGGFDVRLHSELRLDVPTDGEPTEVPYGEPATGELPSWSEEILGWYQEAGRANPAGPFVDGPRRYEVHNFKSAIWFSDEDETSIVFGSGFVTNDDNSQARALFLAVTSSDEAEPARIHRLAGGAHTPTSLGDVDEDGSWELVLVAEGKLQALRTGYRGDVALALPRGDLQNTGVLPARRESIASYESRLPPRDGSWWLAPETEPRSSDFAVLPVCNAVSVSNRATPTESGARVCYEGSKCVDVPTHRKPAHFAFDAGGRRVWAFAKDGTLLAHDRDAARWEEPETPKDPDLDPGSVETLLVADGAVALVGPKHTTLITLEDAVPSAAYGLKFRASDVAHCGERWFANNEGRLVAAFTADLGHWAVVPDHPGPVRSLSCRGRDLTLETGMNRLFVLSSPEPPTDLRRLLWLPAALLLVAAALGAARIAVPRPDPIDHHGEVRRHFGIDVPIRRKEQAAGAQARLAEGLIDFIDNPDTEPPLTIAVCGSWGSGKSSVMNVINGELATTGRHILVWFNAWRFHREEDIAKAFYQTILEEFRRQAGFINRLRVTWTRVRRAGLSGALRFVAYTSAVLGFIALVVVIMQEAIKENAPTSSASAVPVLLGIVATLAGAWSKILGPALKIVNVDPNKMLDEITGRMRFVRDLKSEFETVFSGLKDTMKLVIFVDDLDRCPPERVTDMLEALNVLADTGHCVQVLAMEKVAVERAIEVRFKNLIDHMAEEGEEGAARSYGARYLEKMVTVSVNVPGLDAASVIGARHLAPRTKPESGAAPRPWYRPSFQTVRRRLIDVGAGIGAVVALFFLVQAAGRSMPEGLMKHPAKQLYAWWCDGAKLLAGLDAATSPHAKDEAKSSATAEKKEAPTAAAAPKDGAEAKSNMPETKDSETRGATVPKSSRPKSSAGLSVSPASSSAPRFVIPPQASPVPEPEIAAAPPPATEFPDPLSDERQRLERRESAITAVMLLAVVSVLAGLLALRARQREVSHARQMAKDSEEFSLALERCAADLPPNPRNAIRFANLARFLYYLVRKAEPPAEQRDSSTSGQHVPMELIFCRALAAYWTTGTPRYEGMPLWLKKELGAWLGATEVAGQPKPVAAAQADRTSKRVQKNQDSRSRS
ncbi:P-loop NTPase fold protein [Sorangium cellulosum]|uniref:KAP NTPase domain-containing protein n=1 Tax=Sorangium cellulosum TaxID=56 RepID=A0A150QLQ8_SORCE|nr:P-loop NTPase fold protein [Sorangium cellulosum]KYF68935.1 hypothetical protein BE15_47300 [Sorangium cellulosum]